MIDVDDIPPSLQGIRALMERWRSELPAEKAAYARLVWCQLVPALGHMIDVVGQERTADLLDATAAAVHAHNFSGGAAPS